MAFVSLQADQWPPSVPSQAKREPPDGIDEIAIGNGSVSAGEA
jgi:hypothetical protein